MIPTPAPATPSIPVPAPAPGATASLGGTVIVADDNGTVRLAAARILAALGMRVLTAGNGLEAVHLAESHPEASVVVLDVVMPVMSGLDAFRQLRALRPELPILLVSGYDENHAARDLARQPHAAFLAKPYRVDQLARVIREISGAAAVTA